MKWTAFCAILLIQALVATAQFDVASNMDGQLEQLRLLQEREAATQAALGAEVAPAPEGFSFKATAEAGAQVGGDATKLKKLDAAMTAVKEDIMAKLREAQRESAWVKEVESIVKQYKQKVKNVKKNLTKIRKDIKALIQKKRQIRNAQIQEQLNDRLQDANGDLKMVQDKLASIKAQKKAFDKNRKKIADTIKKINQELKHLRGEKPKPKPKKKAKKAAKKDGKKAAKKDDKKAAKKDDKKAAKKDGKKAAKGKGKKLAKACAKTCKKGDKKCVATCKKTFKACAKKCKKGDKACKKKCLPKKGKKAAKPAAFVEQETEADAEASDADLLAEFADM